MLSPNIINSQIQRLTADVIQLSLCNDQRFPVMKRMGADQVELGFGSNYGLSISMKDIPYRDIYDELVGSQAYNLKMLDGALIQIMYRFNRDVCKSACNNDPSEGIIGVEN